MTNRFLMTLLTLLLLVPSLMAQKGRGENSEGNDLYERGLYDEALGKYQEALEKSPESPILKFNTGDVRYKMEAYDEALEAFQEVLSTEDLRLRAHSLYNLGNAQYRKEDFQGAADSYKEALRLYPDDLDAKHNLEFVLRKLEQDPPPQSQQQDQKDENPEEPQGNQDNSRQDQNERPEDSKDQPQEKEDQPEEQEDGEQPQDQEQDQEQDQDQSSQQQGDEQQESEPQNQQSPPQNGDGKDLPMTREQAEQILEALREDQKDLLRRRTIKHRPAAGGKDW